MRAVVTKKGGEGMEEKGREKSVRKCRQRRGRRR
jgi:hypothetical protein